ncbi:VanW family protein [Patescibacteria group bacterium AH-259-L07]|nr:VanW family protein [Patescibacteria group bacterium AH-259-L07]
MYVIEILKRYVKKTIVTGITFLAVFGIIFFVYQVFYAGKILPGVRVGAVDVGSLRQEEAREKLENHLKNIQENGLVLLIEGEREFIQLENIGFALSHEETFNSAWSVGRRGSWVNQIKERVQAPFVAASIDPQIEVNENSLENEIATLAELKDRPRKDIRFYIENAEVDILYDTKPGKFLDKAETRDLVIASIKNLNLSPINIFLKDDLPQVNVSSVPRAQKEAEQIISTPLNLVYKRQNFFVSKNQIGSWIVSAYERDRLVLGLDQKAISSYVTELAQKINTAPQDIRVQVRDNKVVDFIPPKSGRVLEEDKTIELIIGILEGRRQGKEFDQEISLPVIIKKPFIDETASSLGITELIGKATTPFVGSPENRVHNIKNGVKFLTGILIQPGEEFSTIKSLERIDNTTGYLPELVIKGDRTIPEFGGGLCQVSTTLFRTVLAAGLPITARRNHSYRVPYYEYDGEGDFIGPGLDATIYNPDPDFRFVNDTEAAILIQGYVKGDKITFELYGTKDGRVAEVDGPHTLSTLPPGPPIYAETDTLHKGVTKRIESAHPGGEAVATYKITYPDSSVKEQVFKSYYRKWPARYLVGTLEH